MGQIFPKRSAEGIFGEAVERQEGSTEGECYICDYTSLAASESSGQEL
jgi:hypothetical protein